MATHPPQTPSPDAHRSHGARPPLRCPLCGTLGPADLTASICAGIAVAIVGTFRIVESFANVPGMSVERLLAGVRGFVGAESLSDPEERSRAEAWLAARLVEIQGNAKSPELLRSELEALFVEFEDAAAKGDSASQEAQVGR